jgi:hypothetical protein
MLEIAGGIVIGFVSLFVLFLILILIVNATR